MPTTQLLAFVLTTENLPKLRPSWLSLQPYAIVVIASVHKFVTVAIELKQVVILLTLLLTPTFCFILRIFVASSQNHCHP